MLKYRQEYAKKASKIWKHGGGCDTVNIVEPEFPHFAKICFRKVCFPEAEGEKPKRQEDKTWTSGQ